MAERIGICDSDQCYGMRFLEYVQSSKFYYEICLFTNPASLYEYLESNDMDYLFIEKELCEENIHKYNMKRVYMLINHPEIKSDVDYSEVFKYQPVEDILKVLSKKKSDKLSSFNITTLYTISSSIYSLAFAWSYALSSSSHRKILFIPLDFYPVPLITSQQKETQGISDIIYYLKENNSDHLTKWRKLITNMGSIDYIEGVNHGFDLLTLDEEDMDRWIKSLHEMKEYDQVIFYINVATPGTYQLLSLSTHVLHLKVNHPYEMKREEEWKRQSALMGKGMKPKEGDEVYLMEDNLFMKKVSLTLQELYGTELYQQARGYVEMEREF